MESATRIMAIDQGNTAAKVLIFSEGKAEGVQRFPLPLTLEHLLPVIERHKPAGIVYGSVSHIDAKLVESLRHLCPEGNVLVVTSSTPMPLEIVYNSRATLGVDRIAGAVGASRLHPGEGVMVADAGTAVTVDVVGEDRKMLGGNISPGLALRFKALHTYTDALPLCDMEGEIPPFGCDTHSAIKAGVAWGLKAEIEASYLKAKEKYGVKRLLLTGGDAQAISSLLEIPEEEVEIIEDLVPLGLYHIYHFNENN